MDIETTISPQVEEESKELHRRHVSELIAEQTKVQRLVDFFILGLFLVYVMFLTVGV